MKAVKYPKTEEKVVGIMSEQRSEIKQGIKRNSSLALGKVANVLDTVLTTLDISLHLISKSIYEMAAITTHTHARTHTLQIIYMKISARDHAAINTTQAMKTAESS